LANCFNSRAKSGVVSILQFIEQFICIYALKPTFFHLAELIEGMVNLGNRLFPSLRPGLLMPGFTISPTHLRYHLLEEADFVVGIIDVMSLSNLRIL